MPIGFYRPFVHGELRVEYRNSIQSAKRKEVENGQCYPEKPENFEKYVEPGTKIANKKIHSLLLNTTK